MSRIDEAMRRASGQAVADTPETHQPIGPRHSGRADGGSLDHYPQEIAATFEKTDLPRNSRAFDPGRDPKLVVSGQMPAIAVEQYRRLAATVHEHQLERGLNTLMVTSAVPEEGKTLSVVNLALTLSESFNRRVLLIDADLRRPSLHQIFGFPNTTGLSEWLRSERSDLPVHGVSARLSVLPGGQPDANPMAGLTSERMTRLLRDASTQFDWVLVDAPPVLLLPDAQLLARATRAVVFVIRAGSTPLVSVQKGIAAVGRDYIIGTLLNRAEDHALPATGYDRYGESAYPAK